MINLNYLSENSQHLLFAKRAVEHLRRNGCSVLVNGGSSLGFHKRGNLLLNDRDVDLHVPNKTYDEINEIMRMAFPEDKGVANIGGKRHTFYKTRNTRYQDFTFEIDITTPDNYWSYSGELVATKLLQMFAGPTRSITVQGLEFPVSGNLKETLILCFERYVPKADEFTPVYDEDQLDLEPYCGRRFVIAGKFNPFHYAHKCLIERVGSFANNLDVLVYSEAFLRKNGITGLQCDEERLDYMRCHQVAASLYDGGPGYDDAVWVFAADDESSAQSHYAHHLPGKEALWVRRMPIRCLQPE